MKTFIFKILDQTLEVRGAPELCNLIYEGFDCLLFDQKNGSEPEYYLSLDFGSPGNLMSGIPAWALSQLDLDQLQGEEKYTQHVISGTRLFVYTRAVDGSFGTFISEDMKQFRMTVYRSLSALGLPRIRDVFIPMMLRAIGEADGYLLYHCAAVADQQGRVAIFLAHAGTGKTTISLALMKRGYRLLTDDLAYIGGETSTQVCGILERVNFTEWTAARIPECARYFEENGLDLTHRKQALDVRDIYGKEVVAAQGEAAMVFLLKKDHESPLRIEKMSFGDFLMQMRISQILPLSLLGGKILSDFSAKVEGSYELYTGSDPFKTAEWIDLNWNQLIEGSCQEVIRAQVV